MGLLGISLIVASVVLVCLRSPTWLPALLRSWRQPRLGPPPPPPAETGTSDRPREAGDRATLREPPVANGPSKIDENGAAQQQQQQQQQQQPLTRPGDKADATGQLVDDVAATTPKASAAGRTDPVPTLSLSGTDDEGGAHASPAPSRPEASPSRSPGAGAGAGLMAPPPPPRPPALKPLPAQGPSPLPSRLGPQRTRAPGTSTLPLPGRATASSSSAATSSSSSLAPPPTHTARPAKPSRAAVLEPGHSPLDWARLSCRPGADLRGLDPATPYLRVPPSELRRRDGRRGRDAWTALGGRVYNVTPYLPFHPGGRGELLRAAGKDGTRLFGEIHPWVNYEGMLAACLVGILVSEEEAAEGGSPMDEMD